MSSMIKLIQSQTHAQNLILSKYSEG